jgi:valyl-tRNA synthetase
MGHMLNNTIQDILVRRARMLGKNACWVPGTDHASIATEAKVVDKLESGIDQIKSLTREISETCLGVDRKTRGHHSRTVEKIGRFVRLGPYLVHHGRRTQQFGNQSIC